MRLKNAMLKILGKDIPKVRKKDRFLELIKPDSIFDVGANAGVSSEGYINLGLDVEIYSFEPVSHLFKRMELKTQAYTKWKAYQLGVGEKKEKLEINVSGGHGGASSFFNMTEELKGIAPDQEVIRKESVEIITLTDFYKEHALNHERIFLKIDVQGFELNVIKGAMGIMDKIIGIKLEASIVKQYLEEPDLYEILPYLLGLGFSVYQFEDGWRNPVTSELLQVDIYLFNPKLI
jgi:FkbM family methyltransferase